MEQYVAGDTGGLSACRICKADARLQEQVKTRVATRRIPGEFMRRCGQMLIILAIGVFAAAAQRAIRTTPMPRRLWMSRITTRRLIITSRPIKLIPITPTIKLV